MLSTRYRLTLFILALAGIFIGSFVCSVVTSASTLKIMPLGDSITEGGYNLNSVWYSEGGGYRLPLELRVLPQFPHIEFVGSQSNGPANMPQKNHEGHSGWRIEEISAQVVGWLGTYKPDVILLMIGTNNMWEPQYRQNAPELFKTLLEQIESTLPQTKVLVASIIPTNNVQTNLEIQEYNNAIQKIVRDKESQKKPVTWVDMFNLAGITNDDLTDGVHPTAMGYTKLANVWFSFLDPVFGAAFHSAK